MSIGLQIWNEKGEFVLNTTTRVGTLLGSFETGLASGSFKSSELLLGQSFIFCRAKELPSTYGQELIFPVVRSSGGVISWFFPSFTYSDLPGWYYKVPTVVTYGVF